MNDTTFLPNKMTKSYLLESDPYLKTSTKTSSFALSSDDSIFRSSTVWSGAAFHNIGPSAFSGDLLGDRPVVKPLTMHNVPSNLPPIAYINGNSVRPVRCRHYSQQQTIFPTTTTNNNNTNNNNHSNHNHSSSNSTSEKPGSGKVAGAGAAGDMPHYAQSSQNGVNGEFGGEGQGASSSSFEKKSKVKVQFADDAKSSAEGLRAKPQSSSAPTQSPVKARSKSPSRQSPSSSLRDYVTNNENDELSIYSLYEDTEQVIDHLVKRMEGVMRKAKESRRLVCTDVLLPKLLMAHIAADVIELAESEPCGLRGCHLYICLEDSNSSGGQAAGSGKQPSSHKSSEHSQQDSVASRLLGEMTLDRSVVPTFEVFLTLKRTSLNWLETLENKLRGKDPIVISELYLLHKKKLYQTPSSPTM